MILHIWTWQCLFLPEKLVDIGICTWDRMHGFHHVHLQEMWMGDCPHCAEHNCFFFSRLKKQSFNVIFKKSNVDSMYVLAMYCMQDILAQPKIWRCLWSCPTTSCRNACVVITVRSDKPAGPKLYVMPQYFVMQYSCISWKEVLDYGNLTSTAAVYYLLCVLAINSLLIPVKICPAPWFHE